MDNYPETTFEQDPTAPWNKEDEPNDEVCDVCEHCFEMFTNNFVCMEKLKNHEFCPKTTIGQSEFVNFEMAFQAIESCEVDACDWCQKFKEY